MNEITFFCRPEIIFKTLQERSSLGEIFVTFRIDPKVAQEFKLVELALGDDIQDRYNEMDAVEILVTKNHRLSEYADGKQFYAMSIRELISIKGCRSTKKKVELSSIRAVHADSSSKNIFDQLVKVIKAVSKSKIVLGHPRIFFDEALRGVEICESISSEDGSKFSIRD